MDKLQQIIYERCVDVMEKSEDVLISLTPKEAYVVAKALENQERFTNPILVMEDNNAP